MKADLFTPLAVRHQYNGATWMPGAASRLNGFLSGIRYLLVGDSALTEWVCFSTGMLQGTAQICPSVQLAGQKRGSVEKGRHRRRRGVWGAERRVSGDSCSIPGSPQDFTWQVQKAYPRWQIWCLYVFEPVHRAHNPLSHQQSGAESLGLMCPSASPHVPLGCKPRPLCFSLLWRARHERGP